VQTLRVRLRIGRKCGAREVPPGSGHFIHLDCNLHSAVTTAKPYSPRKVKLLLRGSLKLDALVGRVPSPGQPSPPPQATQAILPDAVDHRADGTEGPIGDQGQVGSCTAFSLASAMDNAIRRQNKPDVMSPMHIWSHYGSPVMRSAGDDNMGKVIAAWESWPYDERVACEIDQSGEGDCGPFLPPIVAGAAKADPIVQAKIRESDGKGHWKVTEYDEIPGDPDTLAAILASGADVWFSMNIGNTWLEPHGDTVADWSDAQIDGGHAVLLSGYRHKNGQRQFLVHNSWGKDWADQGFGYVSEPMVKQFIKHAYKVVVADAGQPPPVPTDPNALTDDDCGETQLVDSVTGQCATMCPDDSRPANGTCEGAAAKRAAPRAP
jgi:Papain family cysteine protease